MINLSQTTNQKLNLNSQIDEKLTLSSSNLK